MKSYKERLPMIDAAIGALGGKWRDHKNYFITAIDSDGRMLYRHIGISMDKVCTRQEFEQRKAELQNKPSWDDAPEWANWLAQGCTGRWYWWSHKPFASGPLWMYEAGENDHAEFKMLEAVKGEVLGNWQDTLEQRPETINKEKQMNNDWYEKGELPPVGDVVEYTTKEYQEDKPSIKVGEWYSGRIIAYHDGFVWTSDNGLRLTSITRFRPLRTETDKLVEQVADVVADCFNQVDDLEDWCATDAVAKAIVEAGYRKVETD